MIRLTAVQITLGLRPKAWMQECRALFQFVRDRIRYVRDIMDVETLHTAEQVLTQGAGDCDDKAILLASLLHSLQHGARFVAIALHNPNNCDHVFVECQPRAGGPWIPCETTEPVEFGFDPLKGRRILKRIYAEC